MPSVADMPIEDLMNVDVPYAPNDIISRTAPTTIGSDQYNQEVARANQPTASEEQDVDWDQVNHIVHTHLTAAAAQAKAKEQAIRFAGQQEFQQLVDGGATPQEALRRTAPKIYYNNPEAMVRSLQLQEAKKNLPLETQTQNGQTSYRTGPNSFAHVPSPNPNSQNAMPLDARSEMKSVQEQIDSAQKEFQREAKAAADKNVSIEERGVSARKAREIQQRLADLQKQRTFVSTNWQGRATAPAAQTAAPVAQAAPAPVAAQAAPQSAQQANEVIRWTKDGRQAIYDSKTKAFLRWADEAQPEER